LRNADALAPLFEFRFERRFVNGDSVVQPIGEPDVTHDCERQQHQKTIEVEDGRSAQHIRKRDCRRFCNHYRLSSF
jgi:hypothetical protein